MKNSSNLIWHLTAIITILVWGTSFVSTKVLLSYGFTACQIYLLRFSLAYLVLLAVSHSSFKCENWRDELRLLICGFTGGAVYFVAENTALQYSMASNVSLIVCGNPLLIMIFAGILYKAERMKPIQILGSLLTFAGMILVVLNGQLILHLNPLGDALALGASLSWGIYSLCIKPLTRHYDSRFITRKVFGYGLLTILPWFWFVEPLNADPALLSMPKVCLNLLYLGCVASLACYLVWNWVLPRLGVVKATNIIYTQSVYTMFFSWLILHERITWMAMLGTMVLISGMILSEKGKKKQNTD